MISISQVVGDNNDATSKKSVSHCGYILENSSWIFTPVISSSRHTILFAHYKPASAWLRFVGMFTSFFLFMWVLLLFVELAILTYYKLPIVPHYYSSFLMVALVFFFGQRFKCIFNYFDNDLKTIIFLFGQLF